jgi:cytochrome c oxidase subunit 3/cytochrome o ubiquinol oxidase subunit 3
MSEAAATRRDAGLGLTRGQVGMLGLIASESAFFAAFVVAYLFYAGRTATGPTPDPVLEVPFLGTACLLGSSVTLMLAARALRADERRRFSVLWGLTLGLGLVFLAGTALEWRRLIVEEELWLDTNLFGTTFYSLVGFHAAHVTAGAVGLGLVLVLALRGRVGREQTGPVELLSWYWHFVDAVWVVVFTVVYGLGR